MANAAGIAMRVLFAPAHRPLGQKLRVMNLAQVENGTPIATPSMELPLPLLARCDTNDVKLAVRSNSSDSRPLPSQGSRSWTLRRVLKLVTAVMSLLRLDSQRRRLAAAALAFTHSVVG